MWGQSLTIEVHDWSFDLGILLDDIHFSHLRALTLSIRACPEPTNASTLAALLMRTPTLQHVAWRYLEPGPLAPGTLPALRSLHAGVPDSPGAAGRGLLPHAALAALGPVCVVPCTLDVMEQMRGEALRALDVARFESITLLVRAVRLFAGLRWLRVPAVDYWHEHAPVTPAPVHNVRVIPVLGYKRSCILRELTGLKLRRLSGLGCLVRSRCSRSSVVCPSYAIRRRRASKRTTSVRAIS